MDNKYKLTIDKKYLLDARYRASIPVWIDDFIKQQAKETGVSVPCLVSVILSDWGHNHPQFFYKAPELPSNDLWKEYRHERAIQQREAEKERRRQQQEAIDELTPERSGEIISLDEIPYDES